MSSRSFENILADAASRFQRLPDWHLHLAGFQRICRRWGSPQIDLFATLKSAQLHRYSECVRVSSSSVTSAQQDEDFDGGFHPDHPLLEVSEMVSGPPGH